VLQEAEQERVASAPVQAGVFVLRYLSSTSNPPPRVFVEVSPASRGDVQIVFLPGRPCGLLEGPNQLALIVAERKGHLQLTVCPSVPGGLNARVELEPLQVGLEGDDATTPKSAAPAEPGRVDPSAPAVPGPMLTCHVAKRGDVCALSGDWIGGPNAPAIIEGVQIDWRGARAAAIEYQTLLQGARGQWSPWVRSGQFSGARGLGQGVVGLRIRLNEDSPPGARLSGEAVFLGSPLIKDQGRELEFLNYAGVDPLVGLRLQMDGGASAPAPTVVHEAEPAQVDLAPAATTLKVFKSKRAGDRGVGLGG